MRSGRESILKAAMEVIGRKGYAGSSTREICKAAGVTKPVLYYHFRSKEHLYEELMIESFSHYLKVLRSVSKSGGDLRKRLVRIVYEDLRSVKDDPMRARFLLRMIFAPEGGQPGFNIVHEMERQRRVIAEVLDEGVRAGSIRGDARELATAVMGMDLMAVLEHLFTGRPTLTPRAARRHVDILLDGCGTRNNG